MCEPSTGDTDTSDYRLRFFPVAAIYVTANMISFCRYQWRRMSLLPISDGRLANELFITLLSKSLSLRVGNVIFFLQNFQYDSVMNSIWTKTNLEIFNKNLMTAIELHCTKFVVKSLALVQIFFYVHTNVF